MSKVSIVQTRGDDYPAIKSAVKKAIDFIGGLSDIIQPGNRVLIKPNLLGVPEFRLSGAVTRWEVCKAIYEEVLNVGGKPFIAESASIGADTEDVILFCGYSRLREEGFEVIDLKSGNYENDVLKPDNPLLYNELHTWKPVVDADVIISVPVMKTHDQTEVTLGLKNLKGLISDSEKKQFHSLGVTDGVVDIVKVLKPALTIFDGTYGQEGMGPMFGDTVKMDLIIASKDVVACDSVASKLMGYEPNEVGILVSAAKCGLGFMDIEDIDIVGDTIEQHRRKFKRANETTIQGVPSSFEIVWNETACTGCRNTIISCLLKIKEDKLLDKLSGKFAVAGSLKREELPEICSKENTVLIGKCAAALEECGYNNAVLGCPPRNINVIEGLIGEK